MTQTKAARDLIQGDCVLVPDPVTIESVEWMTKNGNAAMMLGRGRKSAMALRLRFVGDPQEHFAHPADEFRTSQPIRAADYPYRFPDHWLNHERDPDMLFTRLHSYYVGRVVEILSSAKAKTVLDVGCGDGWASGQMADAGLDVVGIDWSASAVRHACALAPKARFFVADVGDKSFTAKFPDKFDAVTLIEVLEHIPPADCIPALRSIVAPLKIGGSLILTTPSTNFVNNNPHHYQHFTESALREIVAEVGGLEVASIEGYGNAEAERVHYRRARWIDNRYYCIKPALRYLLDRTGRALTKTSLDQCHGLIMTVKRVE